MRLIKQIQHSAVMPQMEKLQTGMATNRNPFESDSSCGVNVLTFLGAWKALSKIEKINIAIAYYFPASFENWMIFKAMLVPAETLQ